MDVERLKKIAKENFDIISESATFLALCTEKYLDDPVCLIQLSLSIMLDKPLFFVIEKKVKLPKKFIRLLDGYEFYESGNEGSFEYASNKLLIKVQRYLEKHEGDEN